MNPAQALHNIARRYCDEKHSFWTTEYSKLSNDGREADGYHYTQKALDIFPRYNVLNAIRVEIERIDPASLEDLEETRTLLVYAGESAEDIFTSKPSDSIEAKAIASEREMFCTYIRKLTHSDVANIDPLPYCRVLAASESKNLWRLLRERWNIPEGYWYPLAERSVEDIEAFQNRYFYDFYFSYAFDKLLLSHGVIRFWELREYGPEYEKDLLLFDPHYNGAEGYWSSGNLDWIIYVSHEGSITVGGWLLDEIKKVWPQWKQRIWK